VEEEDAPEPAEPVHADGEEGAFSQDDFTPDLHDAFLNAELPLPDSGDNVVRAQVIKRAKGEDGNPLGLHDKNSLFDTRKCTMEFLDGSIAECQANIIAENLLSRLDSEGRQHMAMKETSDHKKDG
jgi:hypothetical protein